MAKFTPPPTYADPVIVDERSGKSAFNPIWLKWFLDVVQVFDGIGLGVGGIIQHDNLAGLQGGAANEYFHITGQQSADLAAGTTGTVALAPITLAGAAGSITFTRGIVTAFTAPT